MKTETKGDTEEPDGRLRRWIRGIWQRKSGNSVPSVAAVTVPTLARLSEKIRSLPAALTDALHLSPEIDEADALAMHPGLTERFDSVLDDWCAGRPRPVLVTGTRGTGMTTLLTALHERAARVRMRGEESVPPPVLLSHDARIRTEGALLEFLAKGLGFETRPASLEELTSALVTGPPRLVFVEDLHDFWLRAVGGGAAMIVLLDLIAATSMRVLWVASARAQAVRILEHQYGLGRHFVERVSARLEDGDRLMEIVDRWNAALPLPVRYAGKAASEGSAADSQEELAAAFREELIRISAGNPTAARLYWLDSIEVADTTDEIQLAPIRPPDLEFVRHLERDRLFSLLSVFQHGGLGVAEHGEIYLDDLQSSRRRLESLVRVGLLDPLGGSARVDRYDVNPAADAPLVRMLEELNLIY